MKKGIIIGLFLLLSVFQNCKNKPQEKEESNSTTQETTKTIESITPKEEFLKQDSLNSTSTASPEKELIKVEKVEATTTTKEKVVAKTLENIKPETKVINSKIENSKNKEIKIETEKIIEKNTKPEPVTIEQNIEIIKEIKNTVSPQESIEKSVAELKNSWKVPTKYATMKNPISAKTDAVIGKSLYTKHCKSCHGTEGYGDGTKANEMQGDLGDFSSEDFQKASDGVLFYKTSFGKDDMPDFTKKLPDDEDRWLIVNYLRTLVN